MQGTGVVSDGKLAWRGSGYRGKERGGKRWRERKRVEESRRGQKRQEASAVGAVAASAAG